MTKASGSRWDYCEFNDNKYDPWLSRIEHKIDRIISSLTKEGVSLMSVQDDVNALVAAVQANTTVAGSVKTLLEQLTALIATLKAQATDPATVASLEAAVSALQASTQAISDAVVANTPTAGARHR